MANAHDDLNKDADGNIITRPVVELRTISLADTAVLLAVRHIGGLDEIATGGEWAQLALTPEQCLDLAAMLTTVANKILDPPPTVKPVN